MIKRNLNPGDMAETTTLVVKIVNSNSLDMSANIPADEGLKIRVGMPARIMLASSPEHIFSGCVMSIGQIDSASGLCLSKGKMSPYLQRDYVPCAVFMQSWLRLLACRDRDETC